MCTLLSGWRGLLTGGEVRPQTRRGEGWTAGVLPPPMEQMTDFELPSAVTRCVTLAGSPGPSGL